MHIDLWFEALESAFSVDGGTPLSFLAEVPRLSVEYVPRDPVGSVLYQVVRDHFETF